MKTWNVVRKNMMDYGVIEKIGLSKRVEPTKLIRL